MDKKQLIHLLQTQFGEYLRDEEYKKVFEESMAVFKFSSIDTKTSTDTFYLFLHSLLIHLFGKIKSLENQVRNWESIGT
ncbi:MAG: hypothetical protein HeimC2_30610 [Candidatus Heimdallarchaeota archaeon LC_2]|nr:MAG: hypothetical protein HeimC2_30610 [Candidatus Heimdallarchaeota archaeon LC_2]